MRISDWSSDVCSSDLALAGDSINLYSQIGIVMLVGLAAKNGILIVEFANQLRDEGVEIGEAIRGAAARRLRPILMTSIATVMGAVPLVMMGGAGAESDRKRPRLNHSH